MLDWIKSLVKSAPTERKPDYKIIHDPRLGYIACHIDWAGNWAITEYGTSCVDIDTAMDPFYGRDLWCSTEEEAGRRVNLHATKGGRKTVWRG